MSGSDLKVAVILTGKDTASDVVRRFDRQAKTSALSIARSFDTMGNRINTTTKYVAGLSTAFATWQAKKAITDSAELDKQLISVGQNASATKEQINGMRKELLTMSQETGRNANDLLNGVSTLVAGGQDWNTSLAIVKAMNPAMAVTGASAETLASALGVAKEQFDFDLTKVENSTLLLDQMTVAGRKGNAELENLSDIFARVGPNAKAANMGFVDTLAFVEGLSKTEKAPDRLATLADSTLRLFTNSKYRNKAQAATRVPFYEKDGSKRAPLDIMEDIQKKYSKLKTVKQRDEFMDKAFEGADLDTLKGLRIAFDKGSLEGMRNMAAEINDASGTIARDLPGAINNSIDQTARLKNALREAADGFAQPINKAQTDLIQYAMDEKKLTGKDMLVGGAAAVASTLLLMRGAGGISKAIGSRFANSAAGLAEGKALEAAAGVQPVFVVNMPGSMGGSAAGTAVDVAKSAAGAGGLLATVKMLSGPGIMRAALGVAARGAGMVGLAGTAGYGIGKYAVNPLINAGLSAHEGSDTTLGSKIYDWMNPNAPGMKSEVGGELNIKVDVASGKVSFPFLQQKGGMGINVTQGPYMMGAGS